MRFKSMLMAVAVFAVAACSGRETATVTGSYGTGVVTGQVVMASNGSPAGVEVSVRGTGLTRILGADGQFAFAAIPEEADLDFRRGSDSINASLRLDGTSHVIVELAQTTATKSSGRRRAAGGSKGVEEFEGVVRSATATQVVLFTSKQVEVTIAIAPETVIRKGNKALTTADLVAGTRVHVKATKAADAYSALLILVQNTGSSDDDDSVERREYEGIVKSATASHLVITDAHRVEVTFLLNAQTVIRKGNTTATAAEIFPGMRVHVKATTDGTNTATRVTLQNTKVEDDVKLNGSVTAVSASGLTVRSGNTTWTVQTDASTKLKKKNASIVLADIKVGDQVKVEGAGVAAATVLAKSIEVK